MRITIVTIGTRGDVQPYIALAQGLHGAGHQVTIATHVTFRAFVETHGIAFAPLAGDIRAILQEDAGRQLMAEANPLRAIRRLQRLAAPIIRQVTADILAATRGCDLILGSTLGYLNAVTAAEVHRVPLILAALQPFTPTRAYPIPLLTAWPTHLPFAGAIHRLSYHATYRALQLVMAGMGNQARRALTGLPPLRYTDVFSDLIHARRPVIYGFSEHLVPRPDDYTANVAVTGFWFLDQASDWRPPSALADFLAAGPAPVYVGFGSFGDGDPAGMARAVIDGLRQTGRRGLLLAGWQGLSAGTAGRRHPGHRQRAPRLAFRADGHGRASWRRGHGSSGPARGRTATRRPLQRRPALLGRPRPPRRRGRASPAAKSAACRIAGRGHCPDDRQCDDSGNGTPHWRSNPGREWRCSGGWG